MKKTNKLQDKIIEPNQPIPIYKNPKKYLHETKNPEKSNHFIYFEHSFNINLLSLNSLFNFESMSLT